ncbi:MAG: phospholipid carrier-dependent glycosyltransferase [Vicinamibacteria bacterium]|nr:phospholipid carrier-dependent glycosyltransferase [Vicinamibacteria bacterium]
MIHRRWAGTALIVLIALFAYLAVTSLWRKSATFDEVAYLPSGYVNLALSDYRMIPEHPALVRGLAAFPLLMMDVRLMHDPEERYWRNRRQFEWGRLFLYHWNDGDRLLHASRLVIVALGVILILAVFSWARARHGMATALVAAFFCALSPDVLAHSRLVTTDLAAALLYFLTVVLFRALLTRVTPIHVLTTGLALGAALATKFSAFGLVFILGILALVALVRSAPGEIVYNSRLPARILAAPRQRIVTLVIVFIALFAVAYIAVWAVYGFHFAISPERSFVDSLDWSEEAPSSVYVKGLVDSARHLHLFPEGYLFGFSRFLKHSEARPAFLLGRRSMTGWWYFFPTTFAIKTPIPLMLFVALGVTSLWGRRRDLTTACLWIPVVVYFAFTMTSRLNIGHRHLLPIYPFLFVIAARGVIWTWRTRLRGMRALVLALLAWYGWGTITLHPHYLAYFNEIVGGPRNGYQCLVDSSLDWGQDLIGLRDYMRLKGVSTIKLSYFGAAEPEYYGLPCERLPGLPIPRPVTKQVRKGDLLAISATHLQGLYVDDEMRRFMRRLRRQPFLDAIGHSIFIYRAEFDDMLE